MSIATDEKQIEDLKRKILELQGQLSDVAIKKKKLQIYRMEKLAMYML